MSPSIFAGFNNATTPPVYLSASPTLSGLPDQIEDNQVTRTACGRLSSADTFSLFSMIRHPLLSSTG